MSYGPYDAMLEGEKQQRKDAEHIFAMWKGKEFTIDPKACKEFVVLKKGKNEKTWYGREHYVERKENLTMADWFTNSVSDYERDRGNPWDWTRSAGNLAHAYHGLESYGFVRTGIDEQLKATSTENQGLKSTIEQMKTQMDSMFVECPRCHYKNESLTGHVEEG